MILKSVLKPPPRAPIQMPTTDPDDVDAEEDVDDEQYEQL